MIQLSKLIKLFLSYFPTKLPVGMAQFNAFADSIIALSGEYADRDSLRFAIASMVIHADHKSDSLSKQYFVKRLRKSAANQVASQVFQDIKMQQDKPKVEVTAITSEAKTSSVQTETN